MSNPVSACELPSGQCCVISSLNSESPSSGCLWDKFTPGGESGRDSTASPGVTGVQRVPAWVSCQRGARSPLCSSLNTLLSSLPPGIIFILQSVLWPWEEHVSFGVIREEPAGDACGFSPLPGAPGSPCNCREVFLVCILLLGCGHGSLKRRRISIPGVSGLPAVGELSQCCSYSCWCCIHMALNPSRDGHSTTAQLSAGQPFRRGICS